MMIWAVLCAAIGAWAGVASLRAIADFCHHARHSSADRRKSPSVRIREIK
ncbi:hypothetical protein LCGC14_1820980 [marine sediment metagenome]|uniref:Uncharacterized protein n=1 Tax=marine sediment metagenome TaxID=412755 RepID=A0A0F9GJ02_9ZZZZ